MQKIIKIQFWVLLVGTVFAWVNFMVELMDWINKRECSTGCAVGLVNPFLTPCFYGAIFFLAAFLLSALLIKKIREN